MQDRRIVTGVWRKPATGTCDDETTIHLADSECPELLPALNEYYKYLNEQIKVQDDKLARHIACSADGQLLHAIPGIGVLTASQCMAKLGNVKQFKNG